MRMDLAEDQESEADYLSVSGASKSAVEHLARCLAHELDRSEPGHEGEFMYARNYAAALHDRKLGVERSVCLREVLEALRQHGGPSSRGENPRYFGANMAANFLEEHFTGAPEEPVGDPQPAA